MKARSITKAIRRAAYILRYRTYVPTDYIVLEQKRIIYVPIPKAACTTVKSILASQLSIAEKVIADHELLHERIERLSRHTPPKNSDDYYVFSVVREPLSRLLSCYQNKILHSRDSSSAYLFDSFYNQFIVKNLTGSPLYPGMSFPEFLHAVAKIPDTFADAHFKSQTAILHQHSIHYDALLKLEDGPALEKALMEILGTDEIPLRNRSVIATETVPTLSKELIEEIYQRYKQDYQLLGYAIPVPSD